MPVFSPFVSQYPAPPWDRHVITGFSLVHYMSPGSDYTGPP